MCEVVSDSSSSDEPVEPQGMMIINLRKKDALHLLKQEDLERKKLKYLEVKEELQHARQQRLMRQVRKLEHSESENKVASIHYSDGRKETLHPVPFRQPAKTITVIRREQAIEPRKKELKEEELRFEEQKKEREQEEAERYQMIHQQVLESRSGGRKYKQIRRNLEKERQWNVIEFYQRELTYLEQRAKECLNYEPQRGLSDIGSPAVARRAHE